MKIAIFGRYLNKTTAFSIEQLYAVLSNQQATVCIEKTFLELIREEHPTFGTYETFEILDKTFDFLISVGGDGTILRAAALVKNTGVPIIGINTGRLGFLATVSVDQIEDAIQNITNGNYNISERSLLSVETTSGNKKNTSLRFALNEVAVSRKNTASMIAVEAYLDDEYLTTYWSDGLIVATPTGSTAYSLSCGGPVITPDVCGLVLTPIAPHNLNVRPLIIPDKTTIKLIVTGREASHLISLDSRIATLDNSVMIKIEKADFNIRMVNVLDEHFIKTLQKKMLWGKDKRTPKGNA